MGRGEVRVDVHPAGHIPKSALPAFNALSRELRKLNAPGTIDIDFFRDEDEREGRIWIEGFSGRGDRAWEVTDHPPYEYASALPEAIRRHTPGIVAAVKEQIAQMKDDDYYFRETMKAGGAFYGVPRIEVSRRHFGT